MTVMGTFAQVDTMTRNRDPIGITIIEDNRYLREAWKAILSSAPGFKVYGDFDSCESAFASGAIDHSKVVLMDIGLPGLSGIEGARTLRKTYPDVATVMCTVYEDDKNVFDALCAGAVGYLLKGIDAAELIRAIDVAADGGSPMSPSIARRVIAYFQSPAAKGTHETDELTEREIETLNYLAEGKSYGEIAECLFLTIDAVRSRIRNIYLKLQVHSRGQAVAKGLARRIIRRF